MTRMENKSIEERVKQFILKHRLVKAGQTILVAVSGGADSVCLLQVLYSLRDELKISLQAAHLNHQLRGSESDRDAAFVKDLAERLGLPVTIRDGDVLEYQAEKGLTLEEATREVRYAFLAETAAACGAAAVAAGHTQNDQVETILLHLLRGSGTEGLEGLRPSHNLLINGRSLTVIRPLLTIARPEIEACCRANYLAYCQDSSNLSPAILRNRVRHELIPLLNTYNQDAAGALLRMSRIAADEAAFMESEVTRLWEQTTSRQGSNILIDKQAFNCLPAALQRRIIRRAFEVLLGSLKDIETRHVESVLASAGGPAGRRVNLPGDLVFSHEYNRLIIGLDLPALIPFPPLDKALTFQAPGRLEAGGWIIQSEILPYAEFSDDPDSLQAWQNDGFSADFDLDQAGRQFTLRSWQPGDFFQPLGLAQTKKVARFMLDARIPHDWRPRVPLICNTRQIIWVAGWRIDERVKVTPATRSILRIKLTRAAQPGLNRI